MKKLLIVTIIGEDLARIPKKIIEQFLIGKR